MASNQIEEEIDDTINQDLIPAPSDSALLVIRPYTEVLQATNETCANRSGVLLSKDGEPRVQILLTTEDARYKRVNQGVLWIVKNLLGRGKPLRSPVLFWLIEKGLANDIETFSRHSAKIAITDPYYKWNVSSDGTANGDQRIAEFQLNKDDVQDLQDFKEYINTGTIRENRRLGSNSIQALTR